MDKKLLLRPEEVGEALGLGRSQVYNMLRRNELPAIKIVRSVRTPVALLEQWVAERAAEPTRADGGDNAP